MDWSESPRLRGEEGLAKLFCDRCLKERAMRYSTAAFVAQSVIVAALLSCADPGHAQSIRAQPVAEKIDSGTFEQKLNDTRANISVMAAISLTPPKTRRNSRRPKPI
jgi:hypothetical protein